MGFLPTFKTRGDAIKFSTDSNGLSFILFSFSFQLDKNVASFSPATADVVVTAKGKQLVVETSRIPAAKAERARFRTDRCQWPLGRPDYEGYLLVEYTDSLFADVSGDAIAVPTGLCL